jgi:hypothetical protein
MLNTVRFDTKLLKEFKEEITKELNATQNSLEKNPSMKNLSESVFYWTEYFIHSPHRPLDFGASLFIITDPYVMT